MSKLLAVVIILFVAGAALQSQKESITTRDIALRSGDHAFTSVVVTNTHVRTFTDTTKTGPVPNRCILDTNTEGVIWRIVLRGAAVSGKDVSMRA